MTPEQIEQTLLTDHNGDAGAALRDMINFYVHRENELEREVKRLHKGVSWGALYDGHRGRPHPPKKPPPPPALDVALEESPR